jgi:hypothetical protein
MSTPPETIKVHLRVIFQDDFMRQAALYLPYIMGTREPAIFQAFLRAFLTVYFDRWPSPQTGAALVKEMEVVVFLFVTVTFSHYPPGYQE